jgi:SAM-dependent methyltransferase
MPLHNNIKAWDDIYSSGYGIMSYPNSILVSILDRVYDSSKHKRILDYGFGSGANLRHLIKLGAEVSGVEVSQSAIDYNNNINKDLKLKADLKLLNNTNIIPFPDNYFDIVIAWGVLYYNNNKSLINSVKEINRVLNKGSIFLGTMIRPGDSAFDLNSKLIDNNLYKTKSIKGQENCTVVIPKSENDLRIYFPGENLNITKTGYKFFNKIEKHWILYYENNK